jgi:hypothetical protein
MSCQYNKQLYDDLKPEDAITAAWLDPGPNPGFHMRMKQNVRRDMPLLARAIERLAYEQRANRTQSDETS